MHVIFSLMRGSKEPPHSLLLRAGRRGRQRRPLAHTHIQIARKGVVSGKILVFGLKFSRARCNVPFYVIQLTSMDGGVHRRRCSSPSARRLRRPCVEEKRLSCLIPMTRMHSTAIRKSMAHTLLSRHFNVRSSDQGQWIDQMPPSGQ